MLLTVRTEFPVLEIVIVRVAVELTVTFPKAKSPERPIIRVAATLLPLTAIVLVPLVALDATVMLPLNVAAEVGAKLTVTFCEEPAAMDPLFQFPDNPLG